MIQKKSCKILLSMCSAAVSHNKVIQANNQLRKMSKIIKNTSLQDRVKFEKKIVTAVPYNAEIIPKTEAVYIRSAYL